MDLNISVKCENFRIWSLYVVKVVSECSLPGEQYRICILALQRTEASTNQCQVYLDQGKRLILFSVLLTGDFD